MNLLEGVTMHRGGIVRKLGLACLAASCLATSFSAVASATPKKVKHLSLSTINLAGGETSEFYSPFFAAAARGYWQKLGLTVTMTQTTASAADIIAALLSGGYQLTVNAGQGAAIAVQAGGPIQAIMGNGYGAPDEIAVSSTVASSLGMPSTGASLQAAKLKGSHITIGVSNTTSGGYLDLITFLSAQGITYSPGGDVSIVSLGSPTNLTTALAAGKVGAISNSPPVTVLPNTVTIQIGKVAPFTKVLNFVVMTQRTLIKEHPDTIQAFVTGAVEGWAFVRKHPQAAVRYATPYFVNAGITSPEEIQYLVALDLAHKGTTPAMTTAGYNVLKQIVATGGTALTIRRTIFLNNTFVDTAIKRLGLKVPLN